MNNNEFPHHTIELNGIKISNRRSLTLISGPCQLESLEHAMMIAEKLIEICAHHDINFVFKSSFDKANRTSHLSKRGVGIEEGLQIFQRLKESLKVSVLTDVHTPEQCELVAKEVDILQIPAFLCRQTDLILAAGRTKKIVNIKKGQFLSPTEMLQVTEKFTSTGNKNLTLCERGTTFGYNDLVCDMRSLEILKKSGFPTILDVTHSIQQPGAKGSESGGSREFIETLAKAGTAVGIAGVFIETHEKPETAPSDGASMLPLSQLSELLGKIKAIDNVVKSFK
ncbi:3-deoxy-8-phosphooctulonate synthase [Paracoccaceae bacterium]|nr:3-deoxy-8-phosphooctulonate synthase [Paracoccaceae bacterium]